MSGGTARYIPQQNGGDFIKFPRTPHLYVANDLDIRDDKVLSEEEARQFLNHPVIVEEKIDGTNLGISLDKEMNVQVQNRGNYVQPGSHVQYDLLWPWIYSRMDVLNEYLNNRYILFGEWCRYKHSIHYNTLPDWFLGFDVYDRKSGHFLTVSDRNHLFSLIGVHSVPLIFTGSVSVNKLFNLLEKQTSAFGDQRVEGLYLRVEKGNMLKNRAKLVNSDFIREIDTHWTQKPLILNDLDKNRSTTQFLI